MYVQLLFSRYSFYHVRNSLISLFGLRKSTLLFFHIDVVLVWVESDSFVKIGLVSENVASFGGVASSTNIEFDWSL